jgi:hypothetical protein
MVRVRRRIRGKKCSKKGKVVNSSMNMEKPANSFMNMGSNSIFEVTSDFSDGSLSRIFIINRKKMKSTINVGNLYEENFKTPQKAFCVLVQRGACLCYHFTLT